MKNVRLFLSENYQVWEVKLSIYLNRRVFVMSGLVQCITGMYYVLFSSFNSHKK